MIVYTPFYHPEPELTGSATPLIQSDHELTGRKLAITFINQFLKALNFANTDLIDLSLQKWQKMSADEKTFIPPAITTLMGSLCSQAGSRKYSYAILHLNLVQNCFQELISATPGL